MWHLQWIGLPTSVNAIKVTPQAWPDSVKLTGSINHHTNNAIPSKVYFRKEGKMIYFQDKRNLKGIKTTTLGLQKMLERVPHSEIKIEIINSCESINLIRKVGTQKRSKGIHHYQQIVISNQNMEHKWRQEQTRAKIINKYQKNTKK